MRTKKKQAIRNVVVVSDIHAGCRLALCPITGATLDDGGTYMPSPVQRKLWNWWEELWNDWIPAKLHGEPFALVLNGDMVDGVHHGSTTQISHNLMDQNRIAAEIIRPLIDKCEGRIYFVRGTEAHVGQSGVNEEKLAQELGAVRNDQGQYSRHELWMRLADAKNGPLAHFAHHIGTAGSMAYETSALTREMSEMFNDSARWGDERPQVVIRSHRHRHCEVRFPTNCGDAIVFTTPAWQLKTPFAYRVAGARVTSPQVGASIIRVSQDDVLYTQHFVKSLTRPDAVVPSV